MLWSVTYYVAMQMILCYDANDTVLRYKCNRLPKGVFFS